ncbi:hypothetical protein [Cochlodiniinecator piscidefendens]|uniref:hypothetical protein n=1 Tax=Cochlodiniinecator piscidefendens TaxID=2715756 RepID=UPI00140E3C5E|nr:hypothetical protein [Cochlodiniinecator piscidefendens]
MLRLVLGLVLIGGLSGCDSSTMRFSAEGAGQSVTVEGMTFVVYRDELQVQAVRSGFEFGLSIPEVFPKARIAMEQVTECSVDPASLTGDVAVILGKLDCAAL